MARYTPTHEPPDFPDEERLPEEPAPSKRQLLRMFIPVVLAIVVFITALMLVLKFLVIPAMERGDPAAQARGVATLSALQTQEPVTRTQQALASQVTPQPASTPRPVSTAQPATQLSAVARSTGVSAQTVQPAAQETAAPTSGGLTTESAGPTPTQPYTAPSGDTAATPGLAAAEIVSLEGCPAPPAPISVALLQELLQAHQLYWSRRTLALRDLDLAPIEEVATGTELSGTAQLIDELRAEGHAIRTNVSHHICVLTATSEQAQIADAFEDRSIYIDAVTKEPLQPPKPDSEKPPVVQEIKVFQKQDGTWKVIGGLRP